MTSHELAKQLLKLPNAPVFAPILNRLNHIGFVNKVDFTNHDNAVLDVFKEELEKLGTKDGFILISTAETK